MTGKWAKLVGKTPWLPDDPSRKEALGARLDELHGLSIAELAVAYDEATAAEAEAKSAVQDAAFRREACEIALGRAVESAGLDRATVGGYNYTPSVEPYPNVVDKTALLAYGVNGHPEILSYAHQTIKTLVKAALEGEGDLPPGVDVFLKRTFSRTKAK